MCARPHRTRLSVQLRVLHQVTHLLLRVQHLVQTQHLRVPLFIGPGGILLSPRHRVPFNSRNEEQEDEEDERGEDGEEEEEEVVPGGYCLPRHRVPFNSRH